MADQRFYSLDATRGIAAIAVVIFHMGLETQTKLLPHAYLAVDFFFMLSGFVLGRAYEQELQIGMSAARFMKLRAIRLYPLFALGVVIGALVMAAQGWFRTPHALGVSRGSIAILANLLMLPSPVTVTLFPTNTPGWSLFFELVINAVFALWLFRLSLRALSAFCVLCASAFVYEAVSFHAASLGVGWNVFIPGLFRVGFGFSLGLLLSRLFKSGSKKSSDISLIVILGLAGILSVYVQGKESLTFDISAALVALPLTLFLAIQFELPEKLHSAGKFLGDISYPLYAIHYPLLQIFYFVARKFHLPAFPAASVFLMSATWLSWFLAKNFDIPIRRRLTSIR